ncbi:MAG: LemA family protein [Planctomycetota bacterium]|nr:LemA family protein [Planctomycetota bacterium]
MHHPSRRGSATMVLLGIIGAFILLFVIGGCTAWTGYNKAVGFDENVTASWSQVENQLQRRYDLIPNVVSTIKGLTDHESEVFTNLAQARTGYFNAKSQDDKVNAAKAVEASFAKVMRITENYPQLRSSESFLKLQDQLEGSENRLAVERGRFNDAVRASNTYRRKFPGAIFAGWAGVEEHEYFEVDEAVREGGPPTVDFNK